MTYETKGLKCPYCGFFVSSACECSHGIDKRWQEVKCEICGETFMASRTISGAYYGAPAVEDQEKPE